MFPFSLLLCEWHEKSIKIKSKCIQNLDICHRARWNKIKGILMVHPSHCQWMYKIVLFELINYDLTKVRVGRVTCHNDDQKTQLGESTYILHAIRYKYDIEVFCRSSRWHGLSTKVVFFNLLLEIFLFYLSTNATT